MSIAAAPLHLAPDAALLIFTLGLLLIYIELNRPGWIVPGACGLLLALLAAASLLRLNVSLASATLVASAAALLLLDLFRPAPALVAIAATLALILGFCRLVQSPGSLRIHAPVAVLCGLALGGGTSVLARIARRARANKAVD
jgi:membrane-bound serine protease (ClpP class)